MSARGHVRLGLVAGVLVAPAPAQAAEPVVISRPRDTITDLFFYAGYGEVAWNWRDGGRAGSSVLVADRPESERPPGLVDAPFGQYGIDGSVAAFSHRGRIRVDRGGGLITVARGRRRVSGERLRAESDARQMVAWVERRRRLYVSVADSPDSPFGRPRLLAKGRIRAMDLAGRREFAVVWQDGRNRIRARIIGRHSQHFRRPLTLASPRRRVDELRATYNVGGRGTVLWSTASGVRLVTKDGYGPSFGKPVKVGSAPASGLVATTTVVQAWGEPGAIRTIAICPDGIRQQTLDVDGTPHLDGLNSPHQPVYTMNGKVYFVDEPLGRGHDARIISHDVVWIDGGRVMKATPDTPQAPSGEFAPYPCA